MHGLQKMKMAAEKGGDGKEESRVEGGFDAKKKKPTHMVEEGVRAPASA